LEVGFVVGFEEREKPFIVGLVVEVLDGGSSFEGDIMGNLR
jgi:hypothetical protein